MYNTHSIDFMDFSFNGKKLSEFGGYVGSLDGGFKVYSGLPSREIVSDKALNSDIETVFKSYLTSRTFSVPIVFEELDDGQIRHICAWLNSPVPSKFFFIGDYVYINAMLDTDAFNFETIGGWDGELELKFIAHDPYYYATNNYVLENKAVVSAKQYDGVNDGSVIAFPYLTINATGTIKIEIYDSSNVIYSTSNVTGVTAGVNIDTFNRTCTTLTGGNLINNIDEFPIIPIGNFKIKITGSVTTFKLTLKPRYI